MIFNTELTIEAICGVQVSLEQLEELDKQNTMEIEESASPTPTNYTKTHNKKKRSRFAVDDPEKILEEASQDSQPNSESNPANKKTGPQGRRKRKGKYRKSY